MDVGGESVWFRGSLFHILEESGEYLDEGKGVSLDESSWIRVRYGLPDSDLVMGITNW